MKKIILSVALGLAISATSFAQLFVGGSVGYAYQSSEYKSGSTTTDGPKYSTLLFAPRVGYYLNEKLGLGATVSLASASRTQVNLGTEAKNSKFNWAFTPFARYAVVSVNKLSLLGEGYLGLFGSSEETKYGSTTTDGPSVFGFGLGIKPVLEYRLTDNWALESELNFLGLWFKTASQSETTKASNTTTDTKSNEFGFGVNTGQTITALNVGVTYTFK